MPETSLLTAAPDRLCQAALSLHAALAAELAERVLADRRETLLDLADLVIDVESSLAGASDLRWPDVDRASATLLTAFDACVAADIDRAVIETVIASVDCSYAALQGLARRHGVGIRMARFHGDPGAYRWVQVAELPHAHNPRKFRRPYVQALGMPAWRRVLLARGAWAAERAAGRMWLRSLPNADAIGPDPHRHLPDVTAVLPAVRQAHATRPFTEQAVRERLDRELGDVGAAGLGLAVSFFVAPIVWTPGDAVVSNGQHRIAAARLQGVDRLLVASP